MEKNKGGRPRKVNKTLKLAISVPFHLAIAVDWVKQTHGLSAVCSRAIEDIWRLSGSPGDQQTDRTQDTRATYDATA